MNVEQAAKICHQTNKAYCEVLGDTSQPEWENAPDWQVKSAIEGVTFHLKYAPHAITPEISHQSWMAQKEADGWEYGEEKDEEKKTHPCMVPFNQLPLEQRTKDYLFKGTVDSLRASIEINDDGSV